MTVTLPGRMSKSGESCFQSCQYPCEVQRHSHEPVNPILGINEIFLYHIIMHLQRPAVYRYSATCAQAP